MRLGGCVKEDGGTIWLAIGNAFEATLASNAAVAPQEVIAIQQGIAADLQGVDCSLCEAGTFWWEPSWCDIAAAPDPEEPRE